MTGLTTAWLLATRRMGAHWRTSVAVGTGILLAAIILAFVPAYSRAMADLGLRFNVEEEAGDSALVTTVAPLRGLATTLPAAEELVAQTVAAGTGWFLEPQDRALRTGTLRADNVESRDQAAKFTLNAVSEAGRLEVVEGALPAAGARETVISPEVAENLGLRVGDTIDVRFALTNCFPPPPPPPGELPPPADPCNDKMRVEAVIPFTISGLVVAVEPEAAFWAVANADPSLIVTEEDGDLHRMFLDYGTFRRDLGTLFPSLPVFATETFAADLTALSAANASGARGRLDQVTAELRASEILVISALDDAFRAFERSTNFSRAPILILAIQVAAVVLVYVGIVAAFLSEELVDETAVLRSRGASVPQVFLLALLEGLTFAIPAVLLGPFIAAGLVMVLGYTPVFSGATDGQALAFSLTSEAFPLAAAGALMATLVLAAPVAISARKSAIEGKRTQMRPGEKPFYQRFFLDVAAVLVAGFLLYQLHRQDTVYDADAFGGLSSDPLLLFAPAILSLAVVSVFLRVFPVAMRIAAAVLRPVTGASADLALTNLSRKPGSYARLAVLLTLVAGLGAFAATYAPTVEQSYEDRALYASGPELRLTSLGRLDGLRAETVREALEEVPGVSSAMPIWRGQGRFGQDRAESSLFDILAVLPNETAELIAWRDDFAESGEAELLQGIAAAGATPGLQLPGEPTALAIDVNSAARPSTALWIRVLDADGTAFQVSMGKLEVAGWQTYQVALADDFQFDAEVAFPLTVQSVYFTEPTSFTTTDASPIFLDNFRVVTGGGEIVVESFEGAAPAWSQFSRDPLLGDTARAVRAEAATNGTQVLEYVMALGRSPGKRGVYYRSAGYPPAVIASEGLSVGSGLGQGAVAWTRIDEHAMPIEVTGVTELFPTLSPTGRGFVIVDVRSLFDWGNAIGEQPIVPNEAWVGLVPGADPQAVAAELRGRFRVEGLTLRAEEIRLQTANPVVASGASGLLGVGFVAAFGVLALAIGLSVMLDARRRTVSTAVLRAVGLTPRAVFGALAIEYAVVLVCGTVLGTFMGLQLGSIMLQFLEVTETGAPVIPPFILETRWGVLAIAGLGLLVVTVGSVVAGGVYLKRVAVARAIRLSE